MLELITAAPTRKRPAADGPGRKKSPPPPDRGGGGPKAGGGAPRAATPAILAFRARIAAIMEARRLSRRNLSRELKRVVREDFPGAEGVRGLSSSSIGRWLDESANGPQLIFLMILARALGTTVDAILDPSVPPDRLPSPGEPRRDPGGLTDEEAELLRIMRKVGTTTGEAYHRLYGPRSDSPSEAQIEQAVERALERERRKGRP